MFRKESHHFLLPARKAAGLYLQVTCQGFNKEKLDFILFFFPPGFKMVKAGVKNGGVLRGALSALSSKKSELNLVFLLESTFKLLDILVCY